uniref:AH domain-containing protein n=1 Tax=Mesocestoides corti TaxID=53468 RepID=A0A5K3F908_MESCO
MIACTLLLNFVVLSQVENDTGRFLKSRSSEDKTRAGKMLSAVGKALSHSAQQRLILQNPLTRLEQEVRTFRDRAIGDTANTIARMETARTEYRGALMWMKKVSEELDPDMYKKLDKFRRVQTQVKKSKAVFDRFKLTCMQKVDLLAASRCNMLSHVLAAYQDTLLQFWESTARTMTTVSNSFKGYQYYEFALLKDLTPESRKLAEQTSQQFDEGDGQLGGDDKKVSEERPTSQSENAPPEESLKESGDVASEESAESMQSGTIEGEAEPPKDLLPEEEIDKQLDSLFSTSTGNVDDLLFSSLGDTKQAVPEAVGDLFQSFESAGSLADEKLAQDSAFLKEILSLSPTKPANQSTGLGDPGSPQQPTDGSFFRVNWDSHMSDVFSASASGGISRPPMAPAIGGFISLQSQKPQSAAPNKPISGNRWPQKLAPNKPNPQNVDAWMNFFADLTPSENPDQQSKNKGHVLDA